MSFVLEALKKQEAGTDPEAAVSLARAATLHRRHRRWMMLTAVAMAVNVALLLWIFAPPAMLLGDAETADLPVRAAPALAATPPEASEQTAAVAAQPGRGTDAVDAPASSGTSAAASSVSAAPAPSAPPAAAPARTVDRGVSVPATEAPAVAPRQPRRPAGVALADLPAGVRSRFPGIAFSTHVYAEDPELRAVVANGKRHQEGDRIRGLEILEITAGGVVLAFEQYRVEVPIVVDWDSL